MAGWLDICRARIRLLVMVLDSLAEIPDVHLLELFGLYPRDLFVMSGLSPLRFSRFRPMLLRDHSPACMPRSMGRDLILDTGIRDNP